MTTSQAHDPTPQQLSLLPVSELPVQFRLDQRTRQRGLAHIAQIRRQLAAKSAPAGQAGHRIASHTSPEQAA